MSEATSARQLAEDVERWFGGADLLWASAVVLHLTMRGIPPERIRDALRHVHADSAASGSVAAQYGPSAEFYDRHLPPAVPEVAGENVPRLIAAEFGAGASVPAAIFLSTRGLLEGVVRGRPTSWEAGGLLLPFMVGLAVFAVTWTYRATAERRSPTVVTTLTTVVAVVAVAAGFAVSRWSWPAVQGSAWWHLFVPVIYLVGAAPVVWRSAGPVVDGWGTVLTVRDQSQWVDEMRVALSGFRNWPADVTEQILARAVHSARAEGRSALEKFGPPVVYAPPPSDDDRFNARGWSCLIVLGLGVVAALGGIASLLLDDRPWIIVVVAAVHLPLLAWWRRQPDTRRAPTES